MIAALNCIARYARIVGSALRIAYVYGLNRCVCVCVCIYIYIHTHTHTHTQRERERIHHKISFLVLKFITA